MREITCKLCGERYAYVDGTQNPCPLCGDTGNRRAINTGNWIGVMKRFIDKPTELLEAELKARQDREKTDNKLRDNLLLKVTAMEAEQAKLTVEAEAAKAAQRAAEDRLALVAKYLSPDPTAKFDDLAQALGNEKTTYSKADWDVMISHVAQLRRASQITTSLGDATSRYDNLIAELRRDATQTSSSASTTYSELGTETSMSNIKQMTTRQIQDDLRTIDLTWPGGIPAPQADRVNALTRELRRREAAGNVTSPGDASTNVADASQEDLERELRSLAERVARNSGDEPAQARFADVRFELQRRAKTVAARNSTTGTKEYDATTTTPVTPRLIELPSDDEVRASVAETKRAEEFRERVRRVDAGVTAIRDKATDTISGKVMSSALSVTAAPGGNRRRPICVVVRTEGTSLLQVNLTVEEAHALGNALRYCVDAAVDDDDEDV